MEQKGRCTHMTDILAPDDPALQSMADLFKVFGDPTRVRIPFSSAAIYSSRKIGGMIIVFCIISTGNLCPGNRKSAGHDTVCHLSSTPHLKASPPRQQPQRGKVYFLCPRRRPYLYHFPAGFGTSPKRGKVSVHGLLYQLVWAL